MRLSLRFKLAITLILFAAGILLSTLLLARWSFVEGFKEYVSAFEQRRLDFIAPRLAQLYAYEGRWPQDLNEHFGRLSQQRSNRPPPPHLRHRPRSREYGPHPSAIFNRQGVKIAGDELDLSELNSIYRAPIMVDGVLVGELRSQLVLSAHQPLEAAFYKHHTRSSLGIAILTLALAIICASYLSWRMVAPIRQLTQGVATLTSGHYELQLQAQRPDELGELMRRVNSLAQTLQQTRLARRRMFADISHELRTPLTISLAELEAIHDGVRPLTQESLSSLDEELKRLSRLIDDLYELSISDLGALHYHFGAVDLEALTLETISTLPPQHLDGITVEVHTTPCLISIDPSRIAQLLRNLLLNALAYTDKPGKIIVSLDHTIHETTLTIEDTAPAVPPEQCDAIFEPLYRVEQSRSRRTAGAGLGLAICSRIVEAHRGTINASPSSLGGLKIVVSIPNKEP